MMKLSWKFELMSCKSLITTIFLLVFVAVGCKMPDFLSKTTTDEKGGANTTSSDSVPSQGSTFKPGSTPREDVLNSSGRFLKQDSMQAKMDLTGDTPMHVEIEYLSPDRYHMKYSDSMEMIAIGKETYMKIAGKWKKSPANLGQTVSKMRDSFNEEGMKLLKDVEFVGEDMTDGKNAFVYSYKGNLEKDSTTYTSKLWIGKDDGLPLKIAINYSDGGLKQMTTTYAYDPNIKIEAPAMD